MNAAANADGRLTLRQHVTWRWRTLPPIGATCMVFVGTSLGIQNGLFCVHIALADRFA